ncbi:MAG: hypothetical protein GF370_03305 [Candidatus Nealsonbacteria bacterium]|nr:hypothetical protein [Candidatus Nealsonbacteria bacterium]
MKIQVVTENFELGERVLNIIQDKLNEGLEKYLPSFDEDIKQARVKIEKRTRWGYKVSFNMWLPRKEHIFAEETGEDLMAAVTKLREAAEKQIKKYLEEIKS